MNHSLEEGLVINIAGILIGLLGYQAKFVIVVGMLAYLLHLPRRRPFKNVGKYSLFPNILKWPLFPIQIGLQEDDWEMT